MLIRVIFSLLLVIILATAAQTASAASMSTFTKPGWTRYVVPNEGNYTITLANKLENSTIKVIRSGDKIREETTRNGKIAIVIADLKTGLSYQYSYLPDGRYEQLSIMGPSESEHYSIRMTKEMGSGRGESCGVWEVPYGNTGIVEKDCLTVDGVLLWQKIFDRPDHELQVSETTTIDRSPVNPKDLIVPSNLLQISSWGDWSRKTDGPNNEVLLQSTAQENQPETMLRIKKMGTYQMSQFKDRMYSGESYTGDGVTISITKTPAGVLKRVEVKRSDRIDFGEGVLIEPERTRKVHGETCKDFNMALHVTDYTQTDCKTDDGILLERESTSWGAQRPTLTATSLSRNKLTIKDVAPPSDILTNLP